MNNKIKYLIICSCQLFMLFACTKSFDKINTDPNNPSIAPATNKLAYSIQDFGAHLWDSWGDIDEPSSYSGQVAKTQYIDESRYQFRTGTVENMWTYLYREMKTLQDVINDAKSENNDNLQAVAMTMQAYIWQIATDRWRDIPFTEALAADSGKITPAYSTQEEIYPSVLNMLEQANDLFNKGGDQEVGEGDILFNGDVSKWQKFCNSERLRMAIRISNIDPNSAKTIIESILSNKQANPIITNNDDNAFLIWPGSGTGTVLTSEPWYTSLALGGRLNNYAVGEPFIDTLIKFNDPRISVYADHPLDDKTNTVYRGAPIGPSGASPAGGYQHYSYIGDAYQNVPTGNTPFLRAAEVWFDIAEAAYKKWNTGGISIDSAYNKGIDLSFEENGVDVGDYKLSVNVKWNGDPERIYIQKWLALFKDGHEAWAEERRTDVPLLPAAPGSKYLNHKRPPLRYPYPPSESKLNGKNSSQYVSQTVDDYWGEPMWWDTRPGAKNF